MVSAGGPRRAARHAPAHRHRRSRRPSRPIGLIVGAVLGAAIVAGATAVVVLRSPASPPRQPPTAAAPAGRSTPPSTAGTTGSSVVAPTTTTAPPALVTIAAVGDTELGNTPHLPPDPAAYLAPITSALAAPIVFGNLEGTMTNATSSKCVTPSPLCYAFRVPPSYAQVMRQAGFTVLNSANNHAWDFGAQGVADTSAALRSAGIVQAGLLGQIGLTAVGTTTVAFVDFAPYANVNDMLDFATAKALIAKARTEADVVVVYMHAGAEGVAAAHVTGKEEYFAGEDRGNAEAFAHAAIDDGADLVLGSGPHVLRGMQYYHGHLIAYSLGNFANYGDFFAGGELALSGILRVTLDSHGAFVRARFVSVRLSLEGQPSLDSSGAAAQLVNQLSRDDFGSSAALIQPNGTIAPPPASS